MKAERESRITPGTPSQNYLFIIGLFAALGILAAGLSTLPDFRNFATSTFYYAENLAGIEPTARYAGVYKKLDIAPLPAWLAVSTGISENLAALEKEPCDKKAIFALGNALDVVHETRIAANALLGFAGTCPESEGEANRAAELFFDLADTEKVITITSTLIKNNPAIADYHYLRGRALAIAKRYQEAIADYKSTIELEEDPQSLDQRVFVEMANMLMMLDSPCEAAQAISAWIAIAPSERNTLSARGLRDEYSARGCQQQAPPSAARDL
jgi:tetratricopeptide (TPR) repeat protein